MKNSLIKRCFCNVPSFFRGCVEKMFEIFEDCLFEKGVSL